MWHRVAPRLAEEFTVVAADLRGYGQSSKPATTPDHEPYSKRAMARDQVAVMRGLGFERFSVAGHDRGGRCAYRLALDHPDRVEKLAVLDIVPTLEMWRRADMEFGLVNWHWYFLAQPHPFPKRSSAAIPTRTTSATATASTPRRSRTISKQSGIRPPLTRCARTTAPARPSTETWTSA